MRAAADPSTARDTTPARLAFREQFRRLVDPDGKLPPDEREQLAEIARRAHYARLGMLSGYARRRKAGAA